MVCSVRYNDDEPVNSAHDDQETVCEVGRDKQQEVLVIPSAKAVIYERTVVVIVVRALVANGAVERLLCDDHLAENAQVVQVNVVFKEVVNQLDKVELGFEVAGLHPD